jgi:aldehyde dehydrogenase (NAD+)
MFQRLSGVLEKDRARVTHGGATDANENYMEPTLLNYMTDLTGFTSSAVMTDELFGPLLPIYYYGAGQLQWAIDFVTKRDKPLALYHFSTSSRNKLKVATETSSGSMVINDAMVQLTNSELPFGGVGMSGNGAYHGRAGFDAFSHKKSVLYKYSLLDLAQRYPPYTPATERVLRIVLHPISRLQWRIGKLLAFVVVIAAIALGIRSAVKK